MAGVRCDHAGVTNLAADMEQIPSRAYRESQNLIRDGIKAGALVSKDLARPKSGKHARLYPGKMTSAMGSTYRGPTAIIHQGEYGPLPSGQGLLATILEDGVPGKNRPARNLARSLDLIRPAFHQGAEQLLDGLFWG